VHSCLLAAGVAALLALGAWAGWRIGRLPGRWWMAAYAAGPALALLLYLERIGSPLAFSPPFSLLLGSRAEYVLRAMTLALIGGCVAGRARAVHWRWLPLGALAAGTLYLGAAPFLATQLVRQQLAGCSTRLVNGVCIQSTTFTCGPTAAVTALRALDVDAGESALALRAGTNPVSGTLPADLCAAVRALYGREGVDAVYQPVASLSDLAARLPAVVMTSSSFMCDHYIAVLRVDSDGVLLGDPECGLRRTTAGRFASEWHGSAIVFQRRVPVTLASAEPGLRPPDVIPAAVPARPSRP
jgi:predicted double-glycine peptidase